ncbi:MAG: hypothetical protein ACREUQ_00310, partial [Burkholderiales bacterium]
HQRVEHLHLRRRIAHVVAFTMIRRLDAWEFEQEEARKDQRPMMRDAGRREDLISFLVGADRSMEFDLRQRRTQSPATDRPSFRIARGFRRVERICKALVSARQPVRIPSHGGARVRMTKLGTDISDGVSLGQVQRRECVSQIVHDVTGQARALQDLTETLARLVFIDRTAVAVDEHPFQQVIPPSLSHFVPAVVAKPAENRRQLTTHIDSSALSSFGRPELAGREGSLDKDFARFEVQVRPAQC